MPQTLEQCISYLEQAFPVNYDARYAADLDLETYEEVGEKVLGGMRPQNHHLLSLAHSPDVIGLLFSIINQFMGYATFVDNGKLIHAIPNKVSGAIPYMQGSNLPSMLFCGFINWIGHLLSDIVGSSSTRKAGKTGRGAGIPIPFYELFLFCDFGPADGPTIAETMIKVFEEGYDARFGVAMSIPLLLNEMMIRALWIIRQKFVNKRSWRDSIPAKTNADFRVMLIVGHGSFCAVDAIDASAHGIISGGNVVVFICHLNLIGWARFLALVFRELQIRMDPLARTAMNRAIENLSEVLTPTEKDELNRFYHRLSQQEEELEQQLNIFATQIEQEYGILYDAINDSFNSVEDTTAVAASSVRLAQIAGVQSSRIVRNLDELDSRFI